MGKRFQLRNPKAGTPVLAAATKARREHGLDFPSEPSEETNSTDTLISDF
jgi:hypothetical protein